MLADCFFLKIKQTLQGRLLEKDQCDYCGFFIFANYTGYLKPYNCKYLCLELETSGLLTGT